MADPGTLSGELQGKLGILLRIQFSRNRSLNLAETQILQLLRKSQKYEIPTKIDW